MKLFKRIVSAILIAALMLTVLPMGTLADSVREGAGDTAVIKNNYIKVVVNKSNGRFAVRTVDGQPIRKNDQNLNMTYDEDDTSFTTFRITAGGYTGDYIFGNGYELDGGPKFQSSISEPKITTDENGTQKLTTTWTLVIPDAGAIDIDQIITLNASENTDTSGMVFVDYKVRNTTGADIKVAVRVLMDSMVGANDGPAYQNGTSQENVTTVERTMIRNASVGAVVDGVTLDESNKNYYDIANYFMMRDRGSYTDPLATSIYAYGFNSVNVEVSEGTSLNTSLCDKIVVGHWAHMANSKYDIEVDPHLDFTTDTNKYGTADSAVAYFWEPVTVATNTTRSYRVVYGLGEITNDNGEFVLTFIDQKFQLETNDAKSAYLGDGIFEIAVQVQCNESSEMQHSEVQATLTLDRNLKFVKTVNGQVVYENGKPVTLSGRSLSSTYKKSKTSQDQDVNYFTAGDMCVFRYKVVAEGRAWPTTQEYMIQVTSPEMGEKAAAANNAFTVEDTSSIRSDFILLPAVGEMMQSRAYSVAPEQAYYSDEKIISVGVTNFGAYTLGEAGENKDYPNRNFNVYLQNVLTGDRYLVHPADVSLVDKDGATGIINIDYTGGTFISASEASPYEVNPDTTTNNTLSADPTLPVGKYAVEVRYRGENAEHAELLSFVSGAQIDVNTLKESRLRTGGYLVVARRYKQLSASDYAKYTNIVNALNNASKSVDNSGAVYNIQKTGTLVPYYDVQVFANEYDLNEYKNAINPYTEYSDKLGWTTEMNWNRGEVLLEIKGKVKATDSGYIVDTSVEPAVINRTVTYQGDTLTLSKEILTESFKNNKTFATEYSKLLGANNYSQLSEVQMGKLNDSFQLYHWTLNGNGKLSVSGAKYTFYNQKWNIDIYDGFAKTLFLNDRVDEYSERFNDSNIYDVSNLTATTNGYKAHLNGLTYEQANPMEMIAEGDVYFNQLGIVPKQNYNPGSMQLELVDFRLNANKGSYQLRMGGFVNMSIFRGNIDEVSFDSKGYYGTDANVGFDIWKDIGILKAATKYYGGGYDDTKADTSNQMASGGRAAEAGAALLVRHYREYTPERQTLVAMSGKFKLPVLGGFYVGFTFKEVPSGLILPDCFAFQYFTKSSSKDVEVGDKTQRQAIPGIQIAPNTYMTRVRAAVRNLADTVYGIMTGENVGSMPLQLAGGITVSIPMGLGSVASRIALIGNIDMLLKMTGLKIVGSLELELWLVSLPLVNLAEIQIQWQSPAFLSAKILIDIGDFGILVGKGALFIGERENGDFDFDAYANAAVKIPSAVPVVGGMSLARAFFGINLERITGGFTIIPFVAVCLSYYYGGDIDFWVETDGTSKEDALAYIIHTDEDTGTQSIVSIGKNINYVATSDYDPETAGQQLVYRSHLGADEMLIYRSAGLGGITVDGTAYTIPVGTKVYDENKPADALVEIEYLDEMPTITSAKIDGADRVVEPYETSVDELGNTVYKVPANAPADALYSYTLERDMDGTTQKLLYITVPYERFNSSSNLTLTLSENTDMALLKVGRTSELTGVSLAQNGNQLTMTATAKNAKAGDTVKFFLTPDGNGNPLTEETVNGKTIKVEDQGTLGMLVGTATVGSEQTVTATIENITDCTILDKEQVNLNELLDSGDYYLRAILDSGNSQSEKQTENFVKLVDPKAPQPVTDAKLEVGGNGQLKVSFKPGDDKADSFVLNFYDEEGNDWAYYTDLLVSREDLTDEGDGVYSCTLGTWSEQTTENVDAEGKVIGTSETYSGFQTEKSYKAKVKAAATEIIDGGEKYHFSALTDYTDLVFLPEPVEPKLEISGATEYFKHADGDYRTDASDTFAYYSITTNKAEPEIKVTTDCDATFKLFDGGEKVEFYVGDSTTAVTETTLAKNTETTIRIAGFGNTDATVSLSAFVRNSETKDTAIKSVRITADYTAPTLYIDAPVPGALAEYGMVEASGVTNAEDSVVTVYVDDSTEGTELEVDENGNFNGYVSIDSENATAKLTFVASDSAGNTNTAIVTVQNGAYMVAQNIVVRTFKSGNTTRLETVARFATSRTSYDEEVVDNVEYSAFRGDVSVENGVVLFGSSDSGIISATYNTPDGATLTAMTVVRKDNSSNQPSQPGNPSGGGSSSGGGTPSGGSTTGGKADGTIGAEESKTEVDKTAVDVTLDENGIVEIDATEGKSVKSELDAEGYRIFYTPGSDLAVDTPIFKADLPASALGDKGEMTVTALDKADVKASGAGSTVLAATSVELGGKGDIKAPVSASFAIPDTVSVNDVTAVVLYDSTGKMTPLPFKLNMIGDKAFVDVVLTDEGTVVLESCKTSFADVKETDWAYNDIMSAAAREVLKGMPDGTFNRTGVCSRSEFATILMRTIGMMTQETSTILSDVSKNAWDYQALAVAKDLGIITGYPDGTIGGANSVSRVEAMVMVGRALKILGISEELSASEIDGILAGFADGAEVPEWARASVALCIRNGIINGSGGKVDCASKLSREQCAAIANRLDGVIVKTLLK